MLPVGPNSEKKGEGAECEHKRLKEVEKSDEPSHTSFRLLTVVLICVYIMIVLVRWMMSTTSTADCKPFIVELLGNLCCRER